LSRRYEAFLVYVSTDYVFKEDKGMYRETEEANPVNYYGLTKLEGERRVIDILDGYCIVRSSVIYGSRPASGKVNFALWIIERLRRDEAVNVLRDQWNSPTLNTNLAEMILEIAERKLTGIYHLAGATKVSRYEFASMIAETFDLNKELIRPVTMDKLEWIAPRPRDSSLDVLKAMKTLRKKPNIIEEALRRLREEMKS